MREAFDVMSEHPLKEVDAKIQTFGYE